MAGHRWSSADRNDSQVPRGWDWDLSELDDVDQDLAGQSVAAIKTTVGPLHDFYTRVENLTIPVTVLRCDFKKKNHMEYLFTIFHRLNTGGMKLNNQEIRNCIYGGTLNKLLKDLDLNPSWRRLNKMKSKQNYRFAKQEIILRFFAFHDRSSTYEGHLAKFLNDYMHDYKDAGQPFLETKRELFNRTVECISTKVFDNEVPSKLGVTLLEALLVGVSKNLDKLAAKSNEQVRSKLQELMANDEFSDSALLEGLSKKPRVAARLAAAIAIFGN